MKIKLFISDIDNTLLFNQESVSLEIFNLFQYLYNKNIEISFNTARSYIRVKSIFQELNLKNNAIHAFNLGSEYRLSNGDLKKINYFPQNTYKELFINIDSLSFNSILCYSDANIYPILYSEDKDTLIKMIDKYEAKEIYQSKEDFLKRISKSRISSQVIRIKKSLENQYLKNINSLKKINSSLLSPRTYILTSNISDKGYATKYLSNYLKLRHFNVVSAGDDSNDEEMFKYSVGIHVGKQNNNSYSKYNIKSPIHLLNIFTNLIT